MADFGYTVQRTSEWRCPEGNDEVDGATAATSKSGLISGHVRGIAGDFVTPNINFAIFELFMEAADAANASSHYGREEWNEGTRHMHVQWGT